MPASAIDILCCTCEEFIEQAVAHGMTERRALETYRRTFRRRPSDRDPVAVPDQPVVRTLEDGNTIKMIQRLGDSDREIESVLLAQRSRAGHRRITLCVSSQVGCALGCAFCQTGRMGFLGNLTTSQIVAQWQAARVHLDASPSNIVFMGMGEPMENLAAVLQAVRVFADRNGPAVASTRITISTAGRTAGIARLAAFCETPGFRRVRLAVSLNAPNDAIRSRLMPINRAEPMAALREAMDAYARRTERRVLIEYVLIPGMNDGVGDAAELAGYLGSLACSVNVIPYNPIGDSAWEAPSEETVRRFARRLIDLGLFVTRRQTLGGAVHAACGQLGSGGQA